MLKNAHLYVTNDSETCVAQNEQRRPTAKESNSWPKMNLAIKLDTVSTGYWNRTVSFNIGLLLHTTGHAEIFTLFSVLILNKAFIQFYSVMKIFFQTVIKSDYCIKTLNYGYNS